MASMFLASSVKLSRSPNFLEWTETLQAGFVQAKEALAHATLLQHPFPDAPLCLSIDASDVAVVAILEQRTASTWKPLAFFSRKLRPAETKYSAFDRHLLSMHLSVWHFGYFLEGQNFVIFTDHKSLVFAFSKVSDAWSDRQQKQLCNAIVRRFG